MKIYYLKKVKKKKKNWSYIFLLVPRLGNNVIDAEGVSKSFGDKLLYENLNFKLPPAGIVGVIGPNGLEKQHLLE